MLKLPKSGTREVKIRLTQSNDAMEQKLCEFCPRKCIPSLIFIVHHTVFFVFLPRTSKTMFRDSFLLQNLKDRQGLAPVSQLRKRWNHPKHRTTWHFELRDKRERQLVPLSLFRNKRIHKIKPGKQTEMHILLTPSSIPK